MNNKLVSIIITTKNEQSVIRKLLESVVNQNYKKIEIILVDNNSTDSTIKIAKSYIKKIHSFGPERSAQRNYGSSIAKGSFFLFLDADMELTKEVVGECVEIISSNSKVGAITIPEKSVAKNFWERVKAFERSFYNESGDEITDAARFFTRECFEKAGGYDEDVTGPEDWDLPETVKKLGYRIGRISAIIYHHERISSPLDLAKKKYFYALTAYKYLRKHNIPTFSPKTIYILRPVFYKNFDRILFHPILSLGMFVMLFLQLLGGGLGYIVGRVKQL